MKASAYQFALEIQGLCRERSPRRAFFHRVVSQRAKVRASGGRCYNPSMAIWGGHGTSRQRGHEEPGEVEVPKGIRAPLEVVSILSERV